VGVGSRIFPVPNQAWPILLIPGHVSFLIDFFDFKTGLLPQRRFHAVEVNTPSHHVFMGLFCPQSFTPRTSFTHFSLSDERVFEPSCWLLFIFRPHGPPPSECYLASWCHLCYKGSTFVAGLSGYLRNPTIFFSKNFPGSVPFGWVFTPPTGPNSSSRWTPRNRKVPPLLGVQKKGGVFPLSVTFSSPVYFPSPFILFLFLSSLCRFHRHVVFPFNHCFVFKNPPKNPAVWWLVSPFFFFFFFPPPNTPPGCLPTCRTAPKGFFFSHELFVKRVGCLVCDYFWHRAVSLNLFKLVLRPRPTKTTDPRSAFPVYTLWLLFSQLLFFPSYDSIFKQNNKCSVEGNPVCLRSASVFLPCLTPVLLSCGFINKQSQ